MKTIIKAEGIYKTFQDEEEILKGVQLEVEENTFTVILGPSGSGKSTLLNIMSGMLKPTAGRVWFRGEEVTSLRENDLAKWKRNHIGNIFQNYLLLENLTVRENIEIGKRQKPTADEENLDFDELVKMLQIEDLLDKFPGQLSGGQQQRVAIARAVIKKPEVLFCDEATGALDEENSKKVVGLLHELKKRYGITILFITHNHQISYTADRVITIKNGQISHDYINESPIEAKDMVWE
ncbi:ABC transporter ATP-binding protein [Roseburia hominis]|uniref:ABC transporter ATP-binding protein n=1 Tax=Roseburia hominis TaxID=301301 RepID=UPI001F40357A|nr:ABC transporter ATP-binding protein [Roseburia hominis]